MNILIVQQAGQHKENAEYRECLCLTRALGALGHEAIAWGRGFENYRSPFKLMEKWAHAVVILQNYHDGWLPPMDASNRLKIFWSIDAHLRFGAHVNICRRHKVDIILSSTAAFVKKFRHEGFDSRWFPNCYPDELIRPNGGRKVHDVGFCGSILKDRKKWLDGISQHCKLKRDIFVLGDAMVRAINSYRIHWNKNYSNDVNYRTFETLGCRTLLLTNNTDRLRDLFRIGKHLVTYNSLQHCIEVARYYLNHPKEREIIAAAGHEHARKNHTYRVRASQLVDIIKEKI